jgi:hypothetical protein
MAVGTGVYGTNASNAQPLITGTFVGAGGAISGSNILAIANAANNERVRRGGAALTIPDGYYSGRISASRLAAIRTGVEINGPAATNAYNGAWQGYNSPDGKYLTGYQEEIAYYTKYGAVYQTVGVYSPLPAPETVTYPQVYTNTALYDFNSLYAAGSRVRAAHINDLITLINNQRAACTCNCNYCTCNCNYCTCNCNYSCTCNCNYSDEQLKTKIEYM